MTYADLIECVAGELNTLPELLFQSIKEDEGAIEILREYRNNNASYDDVLDYMNGII